MELWDSYYEDGSKAATTLVRGEKIPQGLFHIIVETLIKHTDGSYLLMQRDLRKSSNPGLFEGSAGGSVLKGETIEEGAKREVYEETGFIVTNLTPIYRYAYPEMHVIRHGFLAIVDGEKNKIVFQDGETIGYKWVSIAELKTFIKTDAYNQDHRPRLEEYLNKNK